MEELIKFLSTQNPEGVSSGDWNPLDYKVATEEDGSKRLVIESEYIGFYFKPDGSFAGIYNFKY